VIGLDGLAPSQPPTPPSKSGVEDEGTVAGALEELQALTAAQQKVLKRAALWESRVERARREIPRGVDLIFYKSAEEVREKALETIMAKGVTP